MRLEDARRLTGPNLYGMRPLVLAEVVLEPGDALERVRATYASELNRLRGALSLPRVEVRAVRSTPRWAAFAFEAPLDEMLVGAEAAEWAGLSAAEVLSGKPGSPLEPRRSELEALCARDFDARLPALQAEAERRGVPFLWDDEQVSFGHGRRGVSYPRHALPEVAAVPWAACARMPIALITGTNGKTTSTRWLARMVQEAGRAVGMSCSDSVSINGKVVREGDWTGPAAAREVLRSPEVEVAVLETARGGILRRGLAVEAADVALLTNISDDHLGTYGIDDLEGMLAVKAVIARVARHVVLNARDERLVKLASTLTVPVTFFRDEDARPVTPAGARGDAAVTCRDGVLQAHGTPLCAVTDVPLTFQGTARYNVENALGAAAAALALGVPRQAIVRALKGFGSTDNPGRGETWHRHGVTLFIDFAHNPDGVGRALEVARSLCSPRGALHVITGSAGDRTNEELDAICDAIHAQGPAKVVLRELGGYLRGRAPGEVPAHFTRALRLRGLTDDRLVWADSEVHALEHALRGAAEGDVVALLVHVERDEVQRFLSMHGFTRG